MGMLNIIPHVTNAFTILTVYIYMYTDVPAAI